MFVSSLRTLVKNSNVPARFLLTSGKVPSAKVKIVKGGEKQDVDLGSYIKGRRVAIVGYPGAFTPVCTSKHLPGFVEKSDELKKNGVDEVLALASNDAFVLTAYETSLNAKNKITFIADGNLELTKALKAETDLSDKGLGPRTKRFAMVVNDGTIENAYEEEGSGAGSSDNTSVEVVLKNLKPRK